MRIGIASHIVLDSLVAPDGKEEQSIGGPPCYAGIVSRRFGFDVSLATKVGRDIPDLVRRVLGSEKIMLQDRHFVDAPTTRFSIISDHQSRQMILKSRCAPICPSDIANMQVDCWLVSPVYEEVPAEVLEAIKMSGGKKNFVMLDPQGYVRLADDGGIITTRDRISVELSGIRAMKVDPQEMSALTGGLTGIDGMRALQSAGIELVVSTVPNEIHLLHGDIHYWAKIKPVDTSDSTGAGDILSGAFCCAYVKEKDPLWALCFGAGAVRAALETRLTGLDKIPSFSKIEENASYFYNTVGFRQLS